MKQKPTKCDPFELNDKNECIFPLCDCGEVLIVKTGKSDSTELTKEEKCTYPKCDCAPSNCYRENKADSAISKVLRHPLNNTEQKEESYETRVNFKLDMKSALENDRKPKELTTEWNWKDRIKDFGGYPAEGKEEAGKREFIICSAVHYRDGVARKQQPLNIESGLVVCGRRHNNCFQTLEEINGFDINLVKATDMGFLTSNNEFKTRKEALIIATRENQIYHNVPYTEGDILTSEDLFLDNDN